MKNQIFARTLLYIILTMISMRLIAQDDCSGVGSGTTTTKTGGNVTTTQNWNVTNYYLITGSYNITGTLNMFEDVFYQISPGVTIIVKNGGTLNITGSTLYAGGNMWAGIKVEGGGLLNISPGVDNNATIAHADHGVNAVADVHGEAEFHIYGCIFCNNETGIYVAQYTAAAMNSEVYQCEFTAPYLKASATHGAGEAGDYGIYVNGLNATANFQIGDDNYYTGSTTFNEFHHLNIAIRSDDAHLVVQDNYIHDLIGTHSTISGGYGAFYQTGILAISTNTSDRYLQVGLAPDLVAENMNNVIRNVRKGIFCRKHVDSYMYSDSIYSTEISAPHHFFTDTALHIETDCQLIDVQDMDIENFNCFGIICKNNSGAHDIHLQWNHIFESVSFASDISPVGIYVTENTTNPVLEVYSNGLEGVYRGIQINNIDDAHLWENIINYEVHTSGGSPVGDAIGICMIDCSNATVESNACYGNWVTGYGHQVRGIFMDNCPYFDLYKNRCDDAGDQIALANASTSGQLHCNQMNVPVGANGIYCYNLGTGATALATTMDNGSGLPSGNYWYSTGVGTPNRLTLAGSTNLGSTTWLINPSPGAYDIPAGTCTGGCPTIATDADANCESTFRLDAGAAYLMSLADMENDYAAWANDYNNGLIEDSPESWYNLYGFWNRIIQDSIDTEDLSDTLDAFYNNIAQTNIPAFDLLAESWGPENINAVSVLLNSIETSNDIEYYWKYTSEIYLNNINEQDEFLLGYEDRDILRGIAELDGWEYGTGVYQARAMLDTIIIFDPDDAIPKYEDAEQSEAYGLFPNPANNYFIIKVEFNSGAIELKNICIYNLIGQPVIRIDNPVNNIISVAGLSPGVYITEIHFSIGEPKLYKLIISR